MTDPVSIGIAGLVCLALLLLIGTPIAFSLALVGVGGITALTSFSVALPALLRAVETAFSTYSFTVIPMFLLMGEIATQSGLSRGLYAAAHAWLGRLPGGLGMATIGASAGFSAICGSSVATAATLGRTALPEMTRYGYHPRLSTGTVAAGGTLGFLIPPSIGFVVYGILTEQSIGRLLTAGVLPGMLLTFMYGLTVLIWALICPDHAPPPSEKPDKDGGAHPNQRWKSLKEIGEPAFVFLAVMGGIWMGVLTPTEAGAAGAGILLMSGVLRKRLTGSGVREALDNTLKHSIMIFLILAGAYVFTTFLALTMIPMKLVAWMTALSSKRYLILVVILFGYLLLGCILDATSMMVLTLPVIFPAILALQFDPLWFGVIAVLMMEAGLITPPLGLNIFVISAVSGAPMKTVFLGAAPFLIAILFTVFIIALYPDLALVLVRIMR